MLTTALSALSLCLSAAAPLLRLPLLSRVAPCADILTFPYVTILPSEREIVRNENACVAEDWDLVARAQPPAVCRPPDDVPFYIPALSGMFAVRNTVANGLRPHSLHDYFISRWPIIDISAYLRVCFDAFRAAKELLLLDAHGQGVPDDTKYDFPFHLLPGGKNGLVVFQREIRQDWWGYTFDLRSHDPLRPAPIHPYSETVDPQSRTDLRLDIILAEARRLNYTDLPFIEEMCTTNIDNRSKLWTNIVLCAPYAGLFTAKHFRFMFEKNESKRHYLPPRMRGPFAFLPFLPCYMSPRNVCERATDGKLRVTADFGAPRNLDAAGCIMTSSPANRPGPLSLNANLKLRRYRAFPEIDYLSVAALNKHVAVLGSVRAFCDGDPLPDELRVCKMKADFTAFYETLGRHARCDNVQLQLVDTFVEYDERLIFGGSDCPHECNRLAFFLVTALAARLKTAFDQLDLDTVLPPRARRIFERWRHARGHGTQPYTLGEFFDDTGIFYFEFMTTLAKQVSQEFWSNYNLEVVDGSDGRKSKLDFFDSEHAMTFLGLDENTQDFVVEIGPEKCADYQHNARELALDANNSKRRRVRLTKVMRVEGQLNFCALGVPGIKGDLQCLRSVTQCGFVLHAARSAADNHIATTSLWATMSLDAAERVLSLSARLGVSRGAAFYPRCRPFGMHGRQTLYIWTDASADYECDPKAFRGWGGMAMMWPLPVLFVAQDLITFNARVKLTDSTAMELFGANEMLAVMTPLLWRFPQLDVCQILDSTAATDIINFCKPSATNSRIFSQQRTQLRALLPAATQVVARAVRRNDNRECDTMSKELLAHATTMATLRSICAERFGVSPAIVQLAPPPGARERMTVATRAHDQHDFPSAMRTRDAYTAASIRRSTGGTAATG